MSKQKTHPITRFALLLSFVFLSACGQESKQINTENTPSKTTAALPYELQKFDLNDEQISAYIIIDGNESERIKMSLSTDEPATASATIPGLSRAVHSIVIRYEFQIDGLAYVLASSTKSIDLSAGSNRLSFAADEYITQVYDADSDGISNAAELKAGTELNVANAFPQLTLSSNATFIDEDNGNAQITASIDKTLTADVRVALIYAGTASASDYSRTNENDLFGLSVSLSLFGETLAVGATREASNAAGINGNQTDRSKPNTGAVYVY